MPKDVFGFDEPRSEREICDHYVGYWLLVKMLDPTAHAGEGRCLVLARSPKRAAMFNAVPQVRKQHPDAVLSVIGGGTKFDGEALRESLARIAHEEEWVSVNNW